MPVKRNALDELLCDYDEFLQDQGLALEKHRPCLVRQVGEFLHYAQEHSGYSASKGEDADF